ncbi:MAG: hypothetical protein ATN31_00850 [Candidatus Epulonipiscioides saccharophilum]|nr:MAG: hypothetical protein ATN31_00850 [Epulopiscium sp. AS2M-Bin001]
MNEVSEFTITVEANQEVVADENIAVKLPTNVLTSKDLITYNGKKFISLNFLEEIFGMQMQCITEGNILTLPHIECPQPNILEELNMNIDVIIPDNAIKIDQAIIKSINKENNEITILPLGDGIEDKHYNYIILTIGEGNETYFANGNASLEDMVEGMIVEVYHSEMITRSIPSKTPAYLINPKFICSTPPPMALANYPVTLPSYPVQPIPADAISIDEAIIKSISTEAKTVTILPAGKEDVPPNWIVLTINENTNFANGELTLEDLEEGMVIEAYHSLMMTRSLPPQTPAYAINPKASTPAILPIFPVAIPADAISINEAIIKSISTEAKTVTILPAGKEDVPPNWIVLTINENTSFANGELTLEDLEEGMVIEASHSLMMTRSLPPQTPAYSINPKAPTPVILPSFSVFIPVDAVEISHALVKNIDPEFKQITVLPVNKEDTAFNSITLLINDDTYFVNGEGTFEDIFDGMTVEVFHSPVQTKSIPPQTEAYLINPRLIGTVMPSDPDHVIPDPVIYEYNDKGELTCLKPVEQYKGPAITIPEADAIPSQIDTTISIDGVISSMQENKYVTSIVIGDNPYDQEIFHLSPETIITQNGQNISANDLKAGQNVTIMCGPTMTLSLPPQYQALEVIVNPN